MPGPGSCIELNILDAKKSFVDNSTSYRSSFNKKKTGFSSFGIG